jgi:FkbM family methyltransferase
MSGEQTRYRDTAQRWLDSLYVRLSRSPSATRCAVRLRNQCERVIQFHLAEYLPFDKNGEGLVAEIGARRASNFVDIGANRGNWASMFIASTARRLNAILFEPSPLAASHLRTTFAGADSIEVVEAAVGDVSGQAVLYEEPGGGILSSLVPLDRGFRPLHRNVLMTTLDVEIDSRGWQKVDYLKIDAEGYDLNVLHGARSLLEAQRIDMLQFEYNAYWAHAGSTLSAASRFLESVDYVVFLIRSEGLFELDYRRYGEYFSYSNFFAVRRNLLTEVRSLIRGRR